MVKAIIFDYFKVITLESELGIWRQYDLDKIYEKEIKDLINQYDKGQSFDWLCQEISKANGVSARELEQAYYSQPELKLNSELIDFIQKELNDKYKIGLLSNIGSEPRQVNVVDSLTFFDDKVLSFEVSLVKPDPEIYRLAAKRLGVRPEECVFVDDKTINVEAAESVGMKGIVYNDHADFMAELNKYIVGGNKNQTR